jgi:hypothetical protein
MLGFLTFFLLYIISIILSWFSIRISLKISKDKPEFFYVFCMVIPFYNLIFGPIFIAISYFDKYPLKVNLNKFFKI